jgi:hypothetical protein
MTAIPYIKPSTMKKNFVAVFFLIMLAGCHFKATKFPENSRLSEGLYRGGNGWELVFLKISNDSAYADFIHLEKFPRELHSDTLQYDAVSGTWKSKTGSLVQTGNYYSITGRHTCETCSQPVPVTINQKIIADRKLTQAYIDSYKNYAYVNMQHHNYIKKDTLKKRKVHYYELKEKHLFFDSLHLMSHERLRVVYKKFQEEYEKE